MKTLGPFDSKKSNLILVTFTETSLYVIRLSLLESIKYHVNEQVPFLFSGRIAKIKAKSLEELKSKYAFTEIDTVNGFDIEVNTKSNWGHTITIKGLNDHYKLSILERFETDNYISVLRDFYGEQVKVIS